MTGSASDSKPSIYAPTQHSSDRSSNRSSCAGLSRQASSVDRITPVAPRSNASQKPRLPPIRQESLTANQGQNAEEIRSRILDGGRRPRKVPPSATAVMESPRRVIAGQLASQAAREGKAAKRANTKLRSAVNKAETLLGSERGDDEQVHLTAGPTCTPRAPPSAPPSAAHPEGGGVQERRPRAAGGRLLSFCCEWATGIAGSSAGARLARRRRWYVEIDPSCELGTSPQSAGPKYLLAAGCVWAHRAPATDTPCPLAL